MSSISASLIHLLIPLKDTRPYTISAKRGIFGAGSRLLVSVILRAR
jgi:hypothetical protein